MRPAFSFGGGKAEGALSPSSVAMTVSKGKSSASSSPTFRMSTVVWSLERCLGGRLSSDGISFRPQSRCLSEQWMQVSFPMRNVH